MLEYGILLVFIGSICTEGSSQSTVKCRIKVWIHKMKMICGFMNWTSATKVGHQESKMYQYDEVIRLKGDKRK